MIVFHDLLICGLGTHGASNSLSETRLKIVALV